MSAIEKLRKLADSTEEIDACAFDMAMMKLGRPILAVVEAQAAEIENAREFRRRCCEYTLSYLDAKGERVMDMERRLIAGYSKLKDNTDAAIRALEGGSDEQSTIQVPRRIQ